jgi:putative membrane protein
MAMHMAVVAVAAPLLALGVAGTRYDLVRRTPALFPPVPLSLVELVVVWAWHAPALHHFARNEFGGFLAEQSSFLFSGLLVWLSALGGGVERRRERVGSGIAALLLTSMHMTLLGALLALSPRSLYSHAGHGAAMSVLEDQHLGGAIMLLVGGVAYLAGGVGLTAVLVRGRSTSTEAAR